MRILLVGGGSGGHIMPTLAVADSLKTKVSGIELLYVGSKRPQDAELVGTAGINFKAIHAGKLRRYFDLENFVDFFRVIQGFTEALGLMRSFRPNVVFAKGGYVSLPVVWAAKFSKIPVVLHESDSVLGMSNRFAVSASSKMATAFPVDIYSASLQPKLVYTGLPLSQSRLQKNLTSMSNRPLVVVLGGSQGATSVNQLVWEVLPEILAKYDLVHQVGDAGVAEAETLRHSLPADLAKAYLPISFDPNLRNYIQAASCVVTRAGSTLHELAAWGAPVIAIPLPQSAGDHQILNAEWFKRQNALTLLLQTDLKPEQLLAEIERMMTDTTYRDALISQIKKLGEVHYHAADKVADLILSEAKTSH